MTPDVLAMSLVAVAILGAYGWLLSGAAVRHEAARGYIHSLGSCEGTSSHLRSPAVVRVCT